MGAILRKIPSQQAEAHRWDSLLGRQDQHRHSWHMLGTQSCMIPSWDASSTRCDRGLRNPSPARTGFSGMLRCRNLCMKPSSSSLSHLTPREQVGELPSSRISALTSFSTSLLRPLAGRELPSLLAPSAGDKHHVGFPSSWALGEHNPSLLGHKYKKQQAHQPKALPSSCILEPGPSWNIPEEVKHFPGQTPPPTQSQALPGFFKQQTLVSIQKSPKAPAAREGGRSAPSRSELFSPRACCVPSKTSTGQRRHKDTLLCSALACCPMETSSDGHEAGSWIFLPDSTEPAALGKEEEEKEEEGNQSPQTAATAPARLWKKIVIWKKPTLCIFISRR